MPDGRLLLYLSARPPACPLCKQPKGGSKLKNKEDSIHRHCRRRRRRRLGRLGCTRTARVKRGLDNSDNFLYLWVDAFYGLIFFLQFAKINLQW
jgi:hypothetical protein